MKTNKNIKYYFFLLGLILCLPIYGQNENTVKGTVSDESGIPLPGVSVIIKNTTTGTATDFDGNYTLKAKSSDVLVFSYLGYTTKEITVGSKSTIDVNMAEEAGKLDEIVVIGYGSTTRRDVTGAIASVSGEDIVKVPVANAAQAIQGKLPGVRVTTQDGRPGANIAIRVRGGGSLTQSNQPLFVVDGFPVGSIDNIPGDQILSIDVLKDASSTAIYGARGANGVIIVTTKGGKSGKPKVTYDGFTQFSTIPEYLPVMNGYDYIAYNWAYGDAIGSQYSDAWERLWLIGSQNGSNSAGIDYYKNISSRDYTKELYNSAFSHSHNVNVSGGNENAKYLLALNHFDQEGNKVGSFFERTNLQLRLDQNLGSKLKFSLNTRYSQISEGDNGGNSTAYYFRPINSADILGDSDITSNTQLGDYLGVLDDDFSPIAALNNNQNDGVSRTLVTNTSLSYEVIPGLTAKTDFSLVSLWSNSKSWSGGPQNEVTEDGINLVGSARTQQKQGWNYRWINTLNYDFQGLGENHKLGLLAGYEVADTGSETVTINASKFPEAYDAERAWNNMQEYYRDPDDGAANHSYTTVGGTPTTQQSLFTRLTYGFKGKYLFTGTFRADGSSNFAPTKNWGYFPAAAFAWRVSEEEFLNDVSWLDDLKVRISYGAVGADGIDAELWKQNWRAAQTRFSIGETRQSSNIPATGELANSNLVWETTITRNLGFDFTLFNGNVTGAIDLYKNSVEDLLVKTPRSALTGFSSGFNNIGATSNKGIEFSLGGTLISSEDFNLYGSFNININKGNIDELVDSVNGEYSSGFGGVRLNPRNDYFLRVGDPVGLLRGYTHDGMYTTADFDYDPGTQIYTLKAGVPDIASGILPNIYGTFSNKPGAQTAYPGVQKLRDINNDGVIDDNDIGVIGDTNPDHTGGFNLSGNYKNFDFNADFTWSVGNDIYNANRVQAYLGNKESGLFRNRFQELAGHYKIYDIVNGQLTKVVEPAALDALNANATTYLPYPESAVSSTFGVEDGSYLRLNTFTLGYSLPQNIIDRLGLNRFRFYGSIFNAFTLTGYKGFDPEVNVNDNDGSGNFPTPGLDLNAYPRPRTYTFGVNIEF
ncbi:SusC/RagA family TonB-linked outer membrane protein [Thalassobellus sediminis]|uniref:SusC/RagA family TonB-linked outer membrane protein n=1 Tax=Thalassobellus sediminis TaxID=3367753 RepID=UPI0037B78139